MGEWTRMKSVIQEKKKSFITGLQTGLHLHHCLHGSSNRKLADKYGLTVWLNNEIHRQVHSGNTELDIMLKRTAQRKFEELYGTREDFMKIFGKNYL